MAPPVSPPTVIGCDVCSGSIKGNSSGPPQYPHRDGRTRLQYCSYTRIIDPRRYPALHGDDAGKYFTACVRCNASKKSDRTPIRNPNAFVPPSPRKRLIASHCFEVSKTSERTARIHYWFVTGIWREEGSGISINWQTTCCVSVFEDRSVAQLVKCWL